MAFEGLKDQVKEAASTAWARFSDSSAYNTLRERFETLQPGAQKAVVVSSLIAVGLVLFMIPYSIISGAGESTDRFEAQRQAIRDLLRASRLPDASQFLLPMMTRAEIEERLQSVLASSSLTPEQMGPIAPIDTPNPLAPRQLSQEGLRVPLKALNLNQIVQIAHQIASIGRSQSLKLLDMSLRESAKQANYFDVDFFVYSFGAASGEISDEGEDAPVKNSPSERLKNLRKRRGGS